MSAAFCQPEALHLPSVGHRRTFALAMQSLPKTVMCVPRQRVDEDRLVKLKSELTAIELWDGHYHRAQKHDDTDTFAHRNRQERGEELLREILRLAGV